MISVGDFFDHLRGDDGLDNKIVGLHLACPDAVGDDVVEEEQAGLVTVDEHPFAPVVLAGHAHTIGIGVGSHHDVGIQCLCISQS